MIGAGRFSRSASASRSDRSPTNAVPRASDSSAKPQVAPGHANRDRRPAALPAANSMASASRPVAAGRHADSCRSRGVISSFGRMAIRASCGVRPIQRDTGGGRSAANSRPVWRFRRTSTRPTSGRRSLRAILVAARPKRGRRRRHQGGRLGPRTTPPACWPRPHASGGACSSVPPQSPRCGRRGTTTPPPVPAAAMCGPVRRMRPGRHHRRNRATGGRRVATPAACCR